MCVAVWTHIDKAKVGVWDNGAMGDQRIVHDLSYSKQLCSVSHSAVMHVRFL